MTDCNTQPLLFASLGSKKIQADFKGGSLTSDAGALLLRQVDKKLGLLDAFDRCRPDPRHASYTTHAQKTLLAQRIFGIALGCEDLNDHQTLRHDPLLQIVTERGVQADEPLTAPPTLYRLEKLCGVLVSQAEAQFQLTHQKQRIFGELTYAAQTWDRPRRVIVKAERLTQGPNTRFIVTNLAGAPQALYDDIYCQRGDRENRIKERQLGPFADRTSCHDFGAHQFPVLLSAAAYVLLENLRRLGLAGTELAAAQVSTIRRKLLKIGAGVICSVRRIVWHLAGGYPLQQLFASVLARLSPTATGAVPTG